jgi:hypothetical protein
VHREDVAGAELRWEDLGVGDVADALLHGDRLVPRVHAEDAHVPAVGVEHPEHHADQRGLTRAVLAEQSDDLAALESGS